MCHAEDLSSSSHVLLCNVNVCHMRRRMHVSHEEEDTCVMPISLVMPLHALCMLCVCVYIYIYIYIIYMICRYIYI